MKATPLSLSAVTLALAGVLSALPAAAQPAAAPWLTAV